MINVNNHRKIHFDSISFRLIRFLLHFEFILFLIFAHHLFQIVVVIRFLRISVRFFTKSVDFKKIVNLQLLYKNSLTYHHPDSLMTTSLNSECDSDDHPLSNHVKTCLIERLKSIYE